MKQSKPILHARDHLPGGADPLPGFTSVFGTWSYEVPLFAVTQPVGRFASTGVGWTFDSAASRGGYVTRSSPAQNDYFGFLVCLWPKGAIFAFYYTAFSDIDYGKIDVDIASLGYQLGSRTVGDPAGKIQAANAPGYGATPSFQNLITDDWYAAAPIGETGRGGILTFIPGGNEGDILTDPTADTDPYTGYSISDGGPGWYALRLKVATKNVSSSGYRMKVASAAVLRVADDGAGL